VEFAVDYYEGTCRVAFYTPAAVAGGFVEAPHAKTELRFVATAAGKDMTGVLLPARMCRRQRIPVWRCTRPCDSWTAWRFTAAAGSCPVIVWRFAALV
jgi:hypothetical protein